MFTYPALLVVQAIFVGCFFIRDLTLDEDKALAAIEEAHPWIMLFDAVVFMLLTFN